jgi:hypothetical protein
MKLIFTVIVFILHNSVFSQDTTSIYSNLEIKKDYEITYYITGGNIYAFRLLNEGIIVKRIFLKKLKVKSKFIPFEQINILNYNRVQNFIDSVELMKFTSQYDNSLIFNSGYPITLEITNKTTNELLVIKRLNDIENKDEIKTLIKLINSTLPNKYKRKFRIYGWD